MSTEDVRAQIVEAIKNSLLNRGLHPDFVSGVSMTRERAAEVTAEAALDACLAVRTEEPCPECGGRKYLNYGRHGSEFVPDPCDTCKGRGTTPGTVPGEPVLVKLLMEQVGWQWRDPGHGSDGGLIHYQEDEHMSDTRWHPVYRIRDESARSIPPGDAK